MKLKALAMMMVMLVVVSAKGNHNLRNEVPEHAMDFDTVQDQDSNNNEDVEGDVWSMRKLTPKSRDDNSSYPPVTNSNARPVDCADYLMKGYTKSGVYVIYPFTCTCSNGVKVWCDMETDGGGWTVFLKRQNSTNPLNFNRTWDEYKKGFGNPNEEYYLGNEYLHMMTHSRSYSIRLDLEMLTGGYNYYTYGHVKINDESDRYRLYLSGSYKGTHSNCLANSNGYYFTTIDRDNDRYSGNCAVKNGGGWWYYDCRHFNPTKGIFNQSLTIGCYYHSYSSRSLKVDEIQIKIRPQICDSSFKTIHLKDRGCDCPL